MAKNKNITYNEKTIYIGLTTRTLEHHLAEHWQTSKGHTQCRFHKFLLNADPELVEIRLIEEVKHTCKADAELYESNLINAYNESMVAKEDKLLNTKLSVNNNKKKEPVKLTKEPRIIEIDAYNNIKRGYTIVEPVI
jgi:hypothetical protein